MVMNYEGVGLKQLWRAGELHAKGSKGFMLRGHL